MGEIVQEEKGQKGGKKKVKKQPGRIDMTPMVDLMCLLLTFFILTAAFNKPKVMVINMPDKNKNDIPPKVYAEKMLNIILTDSDKIYYYVGMIDGKTMPTLIKSNFSKDGIRKVLLEKNKDLFTKIAEYREKRLTGKNKDADTTAQRYIKELKKADALNMKGGPTVLIKPDAKAKYKDIVNLVNEMAITNIGVYAITDMSVQEKEMLKNAPK